ncbi:MAG: family 16 glycoside hydrolase [Pirellulaceae bacterium]
MFVGNPVAGPSLRSCLFAVLVAVLASGGVLGQETKQAKSPSGSQTADKTLEEQKSKDRPSEDKKEKGEAAEKWKQLLPKKGLGDWQVTDFVGEGEVHRDGELLILEMGDPLTGINLKKLGDIPTSGFEIEVQCNRQEGNDFLCGLTFPVGKEFCSLIAGGWGGGLVGLSSVDGLDASENSTSSHFEFKNNQWYTFRVRVDDDAIYAWIDNKEVIRQERDRTEFSTRIEVYPSQPLGLCVFQSKVAVKNFRWRSLNEEQGPGEGTDRQPAKSKADLQKKELKDVEATIKAPSLPNHEQ